MFIDGTEAGDCLGKLISATSLLIVPAEKLHSGAIDTANRPHAFHLKPLIETLLGHFSPSRAPGRTD